MVVLASGSSNRMRTFAKNQTLRTGQNRIANVRTWFANVRVRMKVPDSDLTNQVTLSMQTATTTVPQLHLPHKIGIFSLLLSLLVNRANPEPLLVPVCSSLYSSFEQY